jgi:hypothetical protein
MRIGAIASNPIDVLPKRSTIVRSCCQSEEVHGLCRPQLRIPQGLRSGIRAKWAIGGDEDDEVQIRYTEMSW